MAMADPFAAGSTILCRMLGRPEWLCLLSTLSLFGGCSPRARDATGAAGAASAIGRFLVDENFDATPVGQIPAGFSSELAGARVGVESVPFAGNRSLRLAKPQQGPGVSLTRDLSLVSGKVVIEAKVKALELSGRKLAPTLLSSDGRPLVSVAFEEGAIRASNGPGAVMQTVEPVVADTWYVLRIVLDTAKQRYDLYVDGVKVLTGMAFRNAASALAKVAFQIGDGPPGTLFFDSLRVYELGQFIGGPRGPVFDVRSYGAKGDGSTKDTAAIQAAIDAVPTTGGTVFLHDGKFISGTLTLKSNLTVFLDSSAILKASSDIADFPTQTPSTHNTTLDSCARSILFAQEAHDITLDGGGMIDGDGSLPEYEVDAGGTEKQRAIMLWAVHVDRLAIRNLYFQDGATWGIVPMECNHVQLRNVYVHSPYRANRDGIDIVDSDDVEITDSTFNTEDDAICPKSGVRKGVNNLHVANVNITNVTHANAIKLGTADYGGLKHAVFEDILIKNPAKSALALEATDGGDVSDVTFRRIEIDGSGAPFFLLIENRKRTPKGDIPKIGSIDGVHYQDIAARNQKLASGSLLLGFSQAGVTYPLENISFDDVHVVALGGGNAVPNAPPEPAIGYPEVDMFGSVPAWGYYFRHVQGLTFRNSTTTTATPDVRQKVQFVDVERLTGSP